MQLYWPNRGCRRGERVRTPGPILAYTWPEVYSLEHSHRGWGMEHHRKEGTGTPPSLSSSKSSIHPDSSSMRHI